MTKDDNSIPSITFTGAITVNGPMFDIHDNEHVHIGCSTSSPKREDATDAEETDDAPEEEKTKTEKPEESLNLFAPKKRLQDLLREAWFAELRTDEKYDAHWTDTFVGALMASDYGEGIARQWAVKGVRNKRNQIKGYVVGLLKDAGVLAGSYDAIAREVDPNDKKRKFSHYMGDGKRQPYAEWVKEYVTDSLTE